MGSNDTADYVTLSPPSPGTAPLALYGVERPTPRDRPWVFANFVAGLDGAVAVDGRVGPLTSPADQHLFHHLRSFADVVLVGAGTVRAEGYGPVRTDPLHERARTERGQSPVAPVAVVTASLQLDRSKRLFTDAAARTIVICPGSADAQRRADLEEVADVLVAGDDRVDLGDALRQLHAHGARTVLCEGGPALLAELLEADLLDELCLTLAPVTGGDPLGLVGDDAAGLTRFRLQHVIRHDDELYLRYLAPGRDHDG